jgi:MFS family permease
MFTACFMVPTLFAPAIGEWLLRHCGQISFFATATAAMGSSWILIVGLRQFDTAPSSDPTGYLRLLRDRRLRLPNAAAGISGLGYGFANSFLPLMLAERGLAVGWYFGPFAASLLFTRFVGLSILQRLPAAVLAAIGVAAVGTALALLLVPLAFLAGLCMGLGYAVIHPTTVEWSSRLYPPAARARPVALINTSFHVGSIIAMQATRALLALEGWQYVLSALAVPAFAVFIAAILSAAHSGNPQ